MFRLKFSKFKQAFAVAFIPRILVRHPTPVRKKLNCTFDVFSKIGKSTDSGSKDDASEKQRQIIDRCFGEHEPEKKYEGEERDIDNINENEYVRISTIPQCETKASENEGPANARSTEEAAVQATTASMVEETLAQKVEKIEETPHVEASPKNIEGFNSTPKVMGHDIEFFANEKIQQIDLDDLAKRCVGAPIGNIDELLIKEMKNMSLKDCKSELDMNFIKSHCVEKYYSGIFEHLEQGSKPLNNIQNNLDDSYREPCEPLYLFYENKIEQEEGTDIKSERITPLHTDSLHLFAFDQGTKDFKESGFFLDSCFNFTSDVTDPLHDLPEIISPYDSPMMPFYEYVNKEPITIDDVSETVAETVTDTEIESNMPVAEDILIKREEESDVSEEKDMEALQPEPNISRIIGRDLEMKEDKINYIPNKFGKLNLLEKPRPTVSTTNEASVKSTFETKIDSNPNLHEIHLDHNKIEKLPQVEMLKLLYVNTNSTLNKNKDSWVFSTPSEFASGSDTAHPTTNSAISGTVEPELSQREGQQAVELPENTAISANQNPGEYYSVGFLDKSLNFIDEPLQTMTAENHNIHSAFCTQFQQNAGGYTKDTEDTIQELGYPIELHDPFCHVLAQQELPQNKTVLETLNEQISAATLEKVTFSTKPNEATANDDDIPLSQILKRIRDKSRLEFCRNLLLQCAKPTAKKLTCPPPLDRSKPKTTLHPRPCQPKPKPPDDSKPQPCKPKNDPCAKLIPFFFSTIIRSDVSLNIPFPIKQMYNMQMLQMYKNVVSDDVMERLRNLGERLRFVKVDRDIHFMKDANCARDFEPWIPIPSWPAPKVEKKRPFVCPKEGCKQSPAPESNPPKQKPCPGMPRKRFSFSAVNVPDILIN